VQSVNTQNFIAKSLTIGAVTIPKILNSVVKIYTSSLNLPKIFKVHCKVSARVRMSDNVYGC
jgi:hypothetical protein